MTTYRTLHYRDFAYLDHTSIIIARDTGFPVDHGEIRSVTRSGDHVLVGCSPRVAALLDYIASQPKQA